MKGTEAEALALLQARSLDALERQGFAPDCALSQRVLMGAFLRETPAMHTWLKALGSLRKGFPEESGRAICAAASRLMLAGQLSDISRDRLLNAFSRHRELVGQGMMHALQPEAIANPVLAMAILVDWVDVALASGYRLSDFHWPLLKAQALMPGEVLPVRYRDVLQESHLRRRYVSSLLNVREFDMLDRLMRLRPAGPWLSGDEWRWEQANLLEAAHRHGESVVEWLARGLPPVGEAPWSARARQAILNVLASNAPHWELADRWLFDLTAPSQRLGQFLMLCQAVSRGHPVDVEESRQWVIERAPRVADPLALAQACRSAAQMAAVAVVLGDAPLMLLPPLTSTQRRWLLAAVAEPVLERSL